MNSVFAVNITLIKHLESVKHGLGWLQSRNSVNFDFSQIVKEIQTMLLLSTLFNATNVN